MVERWPLGLQKVSWFLDVEKRGGFLERFQFPVDPATIILAAGNPGAF